MAMARAEATASLRVLVILYILFLTLRSFETHQFGLVEEIQAKPLPKREGQGFPGFSRVNSGAGGLVNVKRADINHVLAGFCFTLRLEWES